MKSPAGDRSPADREPVSLVARRSRRVARDVPADDAIPAEAPAPQTTETAAEATPKARARRRRFDAREQWRLFSAVVMLGCGIVFVLLGWYGAANTNILTEQIPYLISGGLLGLGLIVVAGFLAASASSERDARRLREEIVAALAHLPAAGAATSDGARAPDAHVFAVPGGRSYHVQGCPIVEGKDGVRELTRAAAAKERLAACKLCATD